MPKKPKGLRAKAGNAENEALAVNQAMEAAAEVAIKEAAKSAHYKAVVARGVEKVDALYKAAKDHNSRVHVGGVDLAGGLGARDVRSAEDDCKGSETNGYGLCYAYYADFSVYYTSCWFEPVLFYVQPSFNHRAVFCSEKGKETGRGRSRYRRTKSSY